MQKNLCAFGLILTATLSFASVPARADEQVNTQVTNQSAGSVGENNDIQQQSNQLSVQELKRRGSGDSGSQDNLQQTDQGAAAVGRDNRIEQNSNATNVQQRQQRPVRSGEYYNR
jgi:hypothetical protein